MVLGNCLVRDSGWVKIWLWLDKTKQLPQVASPVAHGNVGNVFTIGFVAASCKISAFGLCQHLPKAVYAPFAGFSSFSWCWWAAGTSQVSGVGSGVSWRRSTKAARVLVAEFSRSERFEP